jgi:hypothetical protein
MAFRANDGWPECGSEQSRSAVQHAVQSSSLPQKPKRVSLAAVLVVGQFPASTDSSTSAARFLRRLQRGQYTRPHTFQ